MTKWLVVVAVCACGYQPLYASSGGEMFHVHLARSTIASAMVAEEVVRGARDELAKEGALAPGDGYPRLEIEVLRADETSEGIVSVDTARGAVPRARASELAIVARGFVTRRLNGTNELDTGDLRAEDVMAAPLGDATSEVWQREDAERAIARRLGGRIVMRVLGHPLAATP